MTRSLPGGDGGDGDDDDGDGDVDGNLSLEKALAVAAGGDASGRSARAVVVAEFVIPRQLSATRTTSKRRNSWNLGTWRRGKATIVHVGQPLDHLW